MLDKSTYREALLQRLKLLDARLHAIETELDAPKSRDWEELAVEREGDEVLEQLGHSGELEIARIRAALGRLRDGSFGLCTSCGEQIAADRLDILPETPVCRSCAAQMS
ncbi:RNA polymerase-binding transcription factor DksA [Roseovarius tolerans]|uniref:RNA polymerase-binding transcription factor DksA n=1 Tax=Roseovarius tolerans TaxID=74031 RepID=A0A0L6CUY2_9RHOB|nr:TraR/DksA C4-type zinc finger protein [Roseovarius tolerans]KNX41475.1 RNA polymerase-binding transcription factor DksA [Roseovarius tolerans]